MSDRFATRAPMHAVPSPCVAVCTMNLVDGLCDGCQRTIDEIAAWSTMGNVDKLRVWRLIGQRKAQTAALAVAPKAV